MFRRHHRTMPAPDPSGEAIVAVRPSSVVVIDDSNFMAQTAGGVTIVDFWAPWCGPCRSFAPIFEEAASDYEGRIMFGKCNVDDSPKTAGLLRILSIPTLVVFGPDGSELERVAGVIPRRQIDALIKRVASPTR